MYISKWKQVNIESTVTWQKCTKIAIYHLTETHCCIWWVSGGVGFYLIYIFFVSRIIVLGIHLSKNDFLSCYYYVSCSVLWAGDTEIKNRPCCNRSWFIKGKGIMSLLWFFGNRAWDEDSRASDLLTKASQEKLAQHQKAWEEREEGRQPVILGD